MSAMPGTIPPPLVSILVPTHNRAEQLSAALDSALAQTHRPIEIIVCDNASTDDTPFVCKRYEECHAEVRIVRHEQNLGATRNFESLRSEARGDFMMFLSDDDWLDERYVSRCLEVFGARPNATLVAGRAIYHLADSGSTTEDESETIDDRDPARRVIAYYRAVVRNGVFYGLTRTSADQKIPPLRNLMGNDWLHVAALAFQGQVFVLDDVAVHRNVGGMTKSLRHVARGLGLGPVQANVPLLAIIYWVVEDIATTDVYRTLTPARRLLLASRCAGILFVRFAHLTVTRARSKAKGLPRARAGAPR